MEIKIDPQISFTSDLQTNAHPTKSHFWCHCTPHQKSLLVPLHTPQKVTFGAAYHGDLCLGTSHKKSLLVPLHTPTKSHFWWHCTPPPKVTFGS